MIKICASPRETRHWQGSVSSVTAKTFSLHNSIKKWVALFTEEGLTLGIDEPGEGTICWRGCQIVCSIFSHITVKWEVIGDFFCG